MVRSGSKPGPASSRFIGLLAGDLPGYRMERADSGWHRFVPDGGGPAIEVASRTEKRFLGRTEVAVFVARYPISLADETVVELRHQGKLKRSGLTALAQRGTTDEPTALSTALETDSRLTEAALPLDFTGFEVTGGPDGCRCQIELMGASHVAIALPPMRSYVHLYPDQREALVTTFAEVGRVVGEVAP